MKCTQRNLAHAAHLTQARNVVYMYTIQRYYGFHPPLNPPPSFVHQADHYWIGVVMRWDVVRCANNRCCTGSTAPLQFCIARQSFIMVIITFDAPRGMLVGVVCVVVHIFAYAQLGIALVQLGIALVH